PSENGGAHAHAGSAFAGGSSIAYDPRDLLLEAGEDARVGGKLPRLTLMEEVLLLGIKDKQGYLSFWNDNISYALRGCILIELALRRRIGVVKDPGRKRLPLPDRPLTVLSTRQTGETLLDETLKMMKQTEDLRRAHGRETWNVLKIGFQLKQVRERLAKGLVDKGVLRTEKRNFLLFDMATHPVADAHVKAGVVNRVVALLTSGTSACRALRAVCLACAAYTASVLDNAFGRLGYEEREGALGDPREFGVWPFGGGAGGASGLVAAARAEAVAGTRTQGSSWVAAVLEVLSKLDSLL
ncbi:Golgi phosphoprotein 3-domain-containing protein, partial [Mycena olivaceomarginata]